MFSDGYFNPAAEALLFAAAPEGQRPGDDLEQQRVLWAAVVERVSAHLGAEPGAWLDVGFGNGGLLFTADEWGYRTLGLDLRPASVEQMQRLGYAARCCRIQDLDERGAFQVISLTDVLEHMAFPRPALEHCAQLLQAQGLLFVSTPNIDTAIWRALDAQQANPYWGEIEHYHCFSRTRLYALLHDCGFEPLHYDISPRFRCGMDVIARKR